MLTRARLAPLAVLLFTATTAACAAAAGAAAGAAGAIAYTERGASAETVAGVEAVASATEAVFIDLDLTVTGREMEEAGREIELEGRRGDMQVEVHIDHEGDDLTHIDVIAREGTLGYDRDFARDILARILDRI